MGAAMDQLRDLVTRIDELSDELTFYRLAGGVVLLDEETDEIPSTAEYLLEVVIAKEVLQVWSAWRQGRVPSLDEACAAIVHYAEWDAYMPVDPD
jgi:hypothetical protein